MAGWSITNAETVAHLRKYVTEPHSPWSWPTDACGYDQHIKFVAYRNAQWRGGSPEEFQQFILDYADRLEQEDAP